MRSLLAFLFVVTGCGQATSDVLQSVNSPKNTAAVGPLPSCPITFGKTVARETYSSRELPPSGGATDVKSVVTVYTNVVSSAVSPGQVAVRYQGVSESCELATFPESNVMDGAGADDGGESYTSVIHTYPANTRVCWKIVVTACDGTIEYPPAGSAAFDYIPR